MADTYLELIAVVDKAEAASSSFGRWVERAAAEQGRPFGWAVRTNDLESIARRLGLAIQDGRRATPSGEVLHWRSAGIEVAAEEPSLPFFIEWAGGSGHPGKTVATHPAGAARLNRLAIRGDPGRMAEWLDGAELPITVRPGQPAVSGIVIAAGAREIRL